LERDERHAPVAVEQVVIEYHWSPPLHVDAVFCSPWPSSWMTPALKPGSFVRSSVPNVSDAVHCVVRSWISTAELVPLALPKMT
jgi:hypothetical protein